MNKNIPQDNQNDSHISLALKKGTLAMPELLKRQTQTKMMGRADFPGSAHYLYYTGIFAYIILFQQEMV